jgi:hypothetical protein
MLTYYHYIVIESEAPTLAELTEQVRGEIADGGFRTVREASGGLVAAGAIRWRIPRRARFQGPSAWSESRYPIDPG